MDQEEYEHYRMQEELQRQGIEGQTNAYAPQIHEQIQQAQSILVEQTNPSKTVENIMLRLKGLKKMPDGTEVKFGNPKMNEKGLEKVYFLLDSNINQNIILSHLEVENISAIISSLGDDLVDNLALNWKEYGIKEKTDLDDINNSILVNVFMALKRAEGQNEKNWLGKISIEQISGGARFQAPKKESFWSKFRLGK